MRRDERVTDEMVEMAARILADDLREIGMSPDSPIADAEGKIVSFWETFKDVACSALSAALSKGSVE